MKSRSARVYQSLFLISGLISGLLLPTALAQAEIVTTPSLITINATRGDIARRTLVLQPTAAVRELRAIALDAPSSDASTILPASAIELEPLPPQLAATDVVSIPIQIDLRGVPSGEFTGSLLLVYGGGRQTVPLIVRVKDPWPWPLITLLLGVFIGMAVSAYSRQGKLSDEVTVSLDNLRKQIAPAQAEARSFWQRTEMYVAIAQNAQAANQLTDAQQALADARMIWNRWLRYQPSWHIQFEYSDTLRDRLTRHHQQFPDFLAIQTLSRDLNEIFQMAPESADPKEFQEQLDQVANRLNTCLTTQQQLTQLRDLTTTLDGDAGYAWEGAIATMQQHLFQLQPDDDAVYITLQQEMAATSTQLKTEMGATTSLMVEKSVMGVPSTLSLVPNAPLVRLRDPRDTKWPLFRSAQGRLRLFSAASYLIAFIVLAGGGFNELYLGKPTFGAKGWGDYLSLLALGFGAEATRNVLMQSNQTPRQPEDS